MLIFGMEIDPIRKDSCQVTCGGQFSRFETHLGSLGHSWKIAIFDYQGELLAKIQLCFWPLSPLWLLILGHFR